MKRFLFLISVLFFLPKSFYAQSLQETKDFIEETIKINSPVDYKSAIFFFNNIYPPDAETFANKELTDEEFKNIIVYGVEFSPSGYGWIFTELKTADIRDIYKVSIQKVEYKGKAGYIINLYLKGNYHSNNHTIMKGQENPENEPLEKIDIILGSNQQAAQRIKRAFIHLGKLKNITIKDGDSLFMD